MNSNTLAQKLLLPLALGACVTVGISSYGQYRLAAVRAHLDRGMEYVQQRRGTRAEAEWKAALCLDPHNAGAYEMLGEYYMLSGRWREGIQAFRWLQINAPQTPHILYHNNGDGTFTDGTKSSGIGAARGHGLGGALPRLKK